jgi:hypothetical protein
LSSTCVYVCVLNIAITSISAKDVKSWLNEPRSKSKKLLQFLAYFTCLKKNGSWD